MWVTLLANRPWLHSPSDLQITRFADMHQSIDAPTANTLLRSGHRMAHTCTACDLKVRGAMKPRSICQKSVPQQKSPNEASNYSTRPVITQQDRPQGSTRVTKWSPNSRALTIQHNYHAYLSFCGFLILPKTIAQHDHPPP